mmetsp:Transcript_15665/g.34046  ORF Transcript_15665/g.34046 Transcript_15665/m.34046 type:complete len:427 (+) Transcript_15665:371-1651(+)
MRSEHTSAWPCSTASKRGVTPSLSLTLTFAPALRSTLQQARWPCSAARWRGWSPVESGRSGAKPAAISSSQTWSCPAQAAWCKGEVPSWSRWWESRASAQLSNQWTTSGRPEVAATASKLLPSALSRSCKASSPIRVAADNMPQTMSMSWTWQAKLQGTKLPLTSEAIVFCFLPRDRSSKLLERDEEEDDDEVVEADALGSFATPLLAPRRISNASVGSTLTTTSWCVERRSSWVRQLFSGKAADDEAFSSASAPVLRQVHFDGEQRELILEGEPQELLNDMIGGWCGAHSALLDGEAAALEQLARDTETIAKAVAIVNEMTEQAGETLSLVEAHASNAEVNTREGVKHLLTATKDAEKTQGVKTAITASTVFLVTGLLAGAPILPAVAMGVVVAPIGWGTSRMVQRQSRKRLQRSIAQRESQLRQ